MQSCLHIAVNKNSINLVKFLLRNGFKETLYLHVIQGDTPLHDAIRINNEQIIETLLSFDGIDKNLLINATNKDGFNCLNYAVVRENLK
jgi:ankyrin repeat protein